MNLEIKQMWVDALRSGKYDQGRGALCIDGQYCCLGVLCDLAEKAGVVKVHNLSADEIEDLPLDSDSSDVLEYYQESSASALDLPDIVTGWAGLLRDDPYILSRALSLTILNDRGVPFSEIADLIEKEL